MAVEPLTVEQRPTRVRLWIFVLAGSISWLLYLHRYAWGVVKPHFKQENPQLSDGDLGWIDAAFLATYGVGQIPFGVAGDRFGVRTILSLGILLWSAAVACLGIFSGVWVIVAVRGLLGLFQAAAYPLVSKLTRSWFPLSYRTSVQGVVTSLGRLGGACSSILVASVLMYSLHLTWQTSLVTIAFPGIALAVVFWLTFRNTPGEHPRVNEAENRLIGEASVASSGVKPTFTLVRSSLPNFLMLNTYAFLSTFADMLYVFWIPQFLKEAKGLDDLQMGLFAPLPLIGGAIGGTIGGMMNDFLIRRTGNRRLSRSLVAWSGKFLAALFIALSVSIDDGRLVMVLLFLVKFFGDWSLPTQWGAITDISGPAAATIFGIVNTVGSVGGFLGSPAMGWAKDQWDYSGLFYGVAGVYLAAAACWLFIDCTKSLYHEVPKR